MSPGSSLLCIRCPVVSSEHIPTTACPYPLPPWSSLRFPSNSIVRLAFAFAVLSSWTMEKKMATHSSILAWRGLRIEEPGGLLSMGSHRVGHNWSDLGAVAESGTTEQLHFHFSLSCIGEEMATHSSVLAWRIPAWWAAVYGIAQSRTQLKRLRSSSSFLKDALQCFIPASTKFCWYFSFHLQGPLEAFPDLKIKVLLSLYPSRVVACCTATAC